jgi:hypothetical protein
MNANIFGGLLGSHIRSTPSQSPTPYTTANFALSLSLRSMTDSARPPGQGARGDPLERDGDWRLGGATEDDVSEGFMTTPLWLP